MLRLRLLAVILLCAVAVPLASADQPEDAIRREIAAVKASAASGQRSGPAWDDTKPMIELSLAKAEHALSAGHLYLSLEELGRAERFLSGADRTQQSPGNKDLDAFQKALSDARPKLAAISTAKPQYPSSRVPLAVRALEESARGQVLPLADAGKLYGPATEPLFGMYYLGEAEGQAKFSAFCQSLRISTTRPPRNVRPITGEIQALQFKTNDAFQPPLSKDKHRDFIALNSMLKLATEFEQSGLIAGSWRAYLLAVAQYGALKPPAVDDSARGALEKQIASELKRAEQSRSDDSVAELFLQQAQAIVASEKPSAADLSRAKTIVDDVVPAYYALLEHVMPAQKEPQTKLARVTLVRWPYT